MRPGAGEVEALERAARALRAALGERPWCRGVGIGRAASGLVLRLNVDPEVLGDEQLPERFRGHPVEVVYIRGYAPRR